MLLYRADDLRDAIEEFLRAKCAVKAVQVVGAFRRRVEVIEEIAFVIESDDYHLILTRTKQFSVQRDQYWNAIVDWMKRYKDRNLDEHAKL